MCDRGAWKVYDRREFSGAPGGDWVHIEISNKYADDPDYYEQKMAELLRGKKPARKPAAKKAAAPAYPRESLREGSKGDDVKLVQEKVGATPDGDFGPKTEKSVKAWQADNTACCGPSDGIVGPKTWGSMLGSRCAVVFLLAASLLWLHCLSSLCSPRCLRLRTR